MRSWLLLYVFTTVLIVATVLIWHGVLAQGASKHLKVAFFDVGQGDSIFIQAPNGNQILIDGGRGSAVLSELGKVMAFSDRSIDVIIATHPDLDHIGGLPEVFARYDVGMFLEPGVDDEGGDYQALLAAAHDEGLTPILARQGTTLALDDGVYLELLFPDRDVSYVEPNTGSIVARLVYGDTSVVLTGDSPLAIEEYLVGAFGNSLKSDILKLGHHGSKTSSVEAYLEAVDPEYGIVSAGCDNGYGHPHQEVVDRLAQFHIREYRTCNEGTIVFESDGYAWRMR